MSAGIEIKQPLSLPGKVEYYYAEVDTWHTTHPSGVEVFYFPNGQVCPVQEYCLVALVVRSALQWLTHEFLPDGGSPTKWDQANPVPRWNDSAGPANRVRRLFAFPVVCLLFGLEQHWLMKMSPNVWHILRSEEEIHPSRLLSVLHEPAPVLPPQSAQAHK